MWSWTGGEKRCCKVCGSGRISGTWFLGWSSIWWTVGKTWWHVSWHLMLIFVFFLGYFIFFFPLFIFSLICVILFVIFHSILWKLYCMLFIGACLLIKEKGVWRKILDVLMLTAVLEKLDTIHIDYRNACGEKTFEELKSFFLSLFLDRCLFNSLTD